MPDDFRQSGGSPWGKPPGGGGSGNSSGRGPTPPDIDKIIREFQEKLKKIFTRWKFIWRKTSDISFNYSGFCLVSKWSIQSSTR